MDCEIAQLLSMPHIMGELDPDAAQCRDLEAHLLSCSVCANEYESSMWVVEFIEEHRALFAAVFESRKKRALGQGKPEQGQQNIQDHTARLQIQQKPVKFRAIPWKAIAVAACVAIGISVWVIVSNSKTLQKQLPPQLAAAPAPSITIELLSDNSSTIIPVGQNVSTSADELKTLVINGRHRLVMNANTALSIEQSDQNSRLGCMVNLTSGEIFAHVEHDGDPFVVSTAHGKAVITGTTFDVKATDTTTTLVVTEGTVQFESQQGAVGVSAGQVSKIVAHSAPTEPVSCNATELTAWATGHEIKTVLAKIGSFSDAYDLTDLWVTAMSGPINLDAIDYEAWVEEKRDWFKREFPWIFQLKDALTKGGIEVDYPELLIQSGDIWQFAYPPVSAYQLSVLDRDSLLKTALRYGYDEQWLLENIGTSKRAVDDVSVAAGRFSRLGAFDEWANCFEKGRKSSEGSASSALLYSLHASTYLANTRTLVWLGLRNSTQALEKADKPEMLRLLEYQVNEAESLAKEVVNQLRMSHEGRPCDEYPQLISDVIRNIRELMRIERTILSERR